MTEKERKKEVTERNKDRKKKYRYKEENGAKINDGR